MVAAAIMINEKPSTGKTGILAATSRDRRGALGTACFLTREEGSIRVNVPNFRVNFRISNTISMF